VGFFRVCQYPDYVRCLIAATDPAAAGSVAAIRQRT